MTGVDATIEAGRAATRRAKPEPTPEVGAAPAHDPRCAAVQFDQETGAYTGRRVFDPITCAQCRDEAAAALADGGPA